jgi:hypothetical protein
MCGLGPFAPEALKEFVKNADSKTPLQIIYMVGLTHTSH